MRPPLTARQRAVLATIRAYIREHGYPPAVREIAAAFGFQSAQGVIDHLRALERKGYIARDRYVARGIRILRPTPRLPDDDAVPTLACPATSGAKGRP